MLRFQSNLCSRETAASRLAREMIVIALVALALVSLYFYGTRNHNYWAKKGIKHDKPLPLVGNNLKNYIMKKSISEVCVEMYWKFPNEKVVGFYRSTRPELIIRDPEIIKRIVTTDFYSYHARGLNPHKEVIEPLLKNLFFVDGDTWRLLRQRMTPAFTSGKLKAMFPLVCERAERLKSVIQAATGSKPKTLDAREIMARFTTDFIGSVGFGLDADSLNQEESAFRKLGMEIFRVDLPLFIVSIMKEIFPELCKHWKYTYNHEKEVIDLVHSIQKQRNYQPSGRNDFIDLMLECQKKGVMVGESIEKVKPDGSPETASIELDDKLFAAQVYVFFAAGFETSSSATSYTLHQLAFHPEVQKKVQEEIDRVLAKHNNKLCYDAVKEMTYLDWTFKEGMRMFPSLGYLIRECTKKAVIPEIDLTVDPGVGVFIPLQALHNDPKYFKNPEEFRPERFHPDEFDKDALKYVYIPFGDGPRACIGERLGLMQSLAGLAALLSKFSVEPAPETKRHPKVDPTSSIVQSIVGGLPLIFREREIVST